MAGEPSGPGSVGVAMPAVAVTELVVRYPTRSEHVTAVDGVSFSADAGAVTALLGPNGAGKTSSVETLEGYRRPTSGTVRVLGLDPIADARALAPRIGVMLQRNGVYLTMGPAEVLCLFASYYGTRAVDPAALVERLGLGGVAKTPWRRLSGGEQQRLSLALALVGRPEVAFLDEPTAAVDPAARIVVREIVAELRDAGTCVVLTTHDIDEAERLADQVVILDHGTVVGTGTPSELMRSSTLGEIRFGAPTGLDTAALSQRLGARVEERTPGEYVVAAPPTPANVAQLTAWLSEHDLPLADLRAGRQSLEDVFLRLTAPGPDETAGNSERNAGSSRPSRRPARRSR